MTRLVTRSAIHAPDEQDITFDEFARSRQTHLRRAAYLLCGDWHLAEDLTQTSLAKLYAVWRRVQRTDSPDAYARKVLYRTFVDETRRRRWWERPGSHEYDAVAPAQDPELRLTLLDALRQVPARSRAVLVLRFWEDQSVEETAAALGCSTGTVKSQTSRGLATLRRILGDTPLGSASSHRTGTGYLTVEW
ncbi:SigE family RNA polymerase sigma factor [Streptomyces flaveus]|uniref:SigE family RNA polymerase sigma factor n=1 Tax=Streptomyces flaveus TaxID=66370 RepID=UPI0033285B17